ncbi:small multi-drug export protein [Candidatus Fermentibacterales bacterium]|nr:small multi-drug export protein [Candidatus Fermentibacterales bacterium]
MGEAILSALSGMPSEIQMLLLSGIPLTELRASIPLAHIMVSQGVWHWAWWEIYALAVLGNLLPVPLILWGLGPVSRFLRRWGPFDRFFEWLFERTRARAGSKIEKYEALGLTIFVAIPLPVTGAWTGSLAAFLFRIPARLSIPAISLGVALAGAVVTLIATGALAGLRFILGTGA